MVYLLYRFAVLGRVTGAAGIVVFRHRLVPLPPGVGHDLALLPGDGIC
jgi:hypothetical protein